MGKYYNTTPWVIPKCSEEITGTFTTYGKALSVKRNELVAGNMQLHSLCRVDDMIFLKNGLLAQVYETHSYSKPYAISIVLPGRMLNYAAYLGIDNSSENILALRKSDIYCISRKSFNDICDKLLLKSKVMEYCISCVTSDYDLFTCMFTCNAEERLAFFYKSLTDNFGSCKIPLKLSYWELSMILYSTVKTVERIIPQWRKKKFIDYENGSTIINPKLFEHYNIYENFKNYK